MNVRSSLYAAATDGDIRTILKTLLGTTPLDHHLLSGGLFNTTYLVKTADCGFTHAAAIKNDGTLWTWGNNYYYELCDGTTTNSNVPKQVLAR